MSSFSLLQSADAFHMAHDLIKKRHSETISALLAHALPLACQSERIITIIALDYHWDLGCADSFHERCPLDGWNDDIIQPARDAVLHYYKARVLIYPSTVLALNPSNRILFILRNSVMQNHLTSKNTCVSIIYPSFFTCFLCIPSVLFIGGRSYYTSSS